MPEPRSITMNRGMFSSLTGDWRTPKGLYEELDREFHFDFDPCPPEPAVDGLNIEWGQRNFVNPPYGPAIVPWVKKGYAESLTGRLVVMLLPSRTDTRWFQTACCQAKEILFIAGRLKFSGHINSAPFPSALILYEQGICSLSPFADWGYLVKLGGSRHHDHPSVVSLPAGDGNNTASFQEDLWEHKHGRPCPEEDRETLKQHHIQQPSLLGKDE